MAAAADFAKGLLASKVGRALAFAASFTICLLAAGMLAITFLGHAHGATIVLDLPETAENTSKPPTRTAYYISDDGAVVGRVTKPIYAGKALLADPALVENTPQGPLPRIADDGRKPMTGYADPAAVSAKFKIAIVVSGLGLSSTASKAGVGQPARGSDSGLCALCRRCRSVGGRSAPAWP